MPFLVIDNAFVVELCRPKSQLVVGIRRRNDKMFCSQEGFHKLMFIRGSLSKFKFARVVVQAGTKLLESPIDSERFEVSINTMGPGQKIFSAVHTSRAKMSPQLLKCARPHFPDSPQLSYFS